MKIFKQNIVNFFNVYHFVGHDKQLKHFLIDSFFICTFKNAHACSSFKNCNLYKTSPVDQITECKV